MAVKVDRDERPMWMRVTKQVSAISGQGGWPLTAFLRRMADRILVEFVFIPRDDRYGRPGMGRVLLAMAQGVWRAERRDEALKLSRSTRGQRD